MGLTSAITHIRPKIVTAGAPVWLTIHGGGPFDPQARYTIKCHSLETSHVTTINSADDHDDLRFADGALLLRLTCEGEQEHHLFVEEEGREGLAAEARVYSLEEDLYALRPFKGDFHMHSDRSDGREPPACVAAACRRIGLDFMAITDHHQYAPSLEAERAFADLPVDLRIYPGEEVHPPDCRVHMVNFGGRFSVNELFKDEKEYAAGLAAVAAGPRGRLSPEEYRQYAACRWCYAKIREAGGLGVFCHPYWVNKHVYNVPEPIIARHFEDLPFDAYELLGGFYRHEVESNLLQVARYHEERSRGKKIPVVGVSDAHGCEKGELFGWYYTIVFAPSTGLDDIIQSVKELRSVAVEALPGATPRAHGPFRLAKYAQFLLREVFPLHDELCRDEGLLMQAHLAGDAEAAGNLAQCQGQTARLMDSLWGKSAT